MKYKIIEKKDLPKSMLELSVEIPWAEIAPHESIVIKAFQQEIQIPGFRKGHAPENILRERVGDMRIIEDMVDIAIKDLYPDIMIDEKLDSLGRPEIVLLKIARDNPISIRITTALVPTADLPDYKKIAKNIALEKVDVSEEEMSKFIEELRTNYAKSTHSYSPDHSHEAEHKDEDLILPELNDEFVKKLGSFENVEDFKTKLRDNMQKDKEWKAREKRRIGMIEGIVAETKVELPDLLVDSEIERMLGQFMGDIEKAGLKFEDYLKHVGKKPEDLRNEWLPNAKKRASMHIVLAEIAKKESLKADETKAKEQCDMILATHKEADSFRVKLYVEEQFRNEAVFEFLEGLK